MAKKKTPVKARPAKAIPASSKNEYGKVKGPYTQSSVRKRIEALFLDNLGKVLTRGQIQEAARDPKTKEVPENWHQRLSELRTDSGYTILSWRNQKELRVEEYLMPSADKRPAASKRVKPTAATWKAVLERAKNACEWNEGGQRCDLKHGEIDPVGGGTVKLTADHKAPHSVKPDSDPGDPNQWQALCGRHQVVKKNYWDNTTGKLNVYAIAQSMGKKEKDIIFNFLLDYYGYEKQNDDNIVKKGEKK